MMANCNHEGRNIHVTGKIPYTSSPKENCCGRCGEEKKDGDDLNADNIDDSDVLIRNKAGHSKGGGIGNGNEYDANYHGNIFTSYVLPLTVAGGVVTILFQVSKLVAQHVQEQRDRIQAEFHSVFSDHTYPALDIMMQ